MAESPGSENQARQGRREGSYRCCTGLTEDAGSRRFAAARGRLILRGPPLDGDGRLLERFGDDRLAAETGGARLGAEDEPV
jgi:hypothetical protein